jgi:hypothetical protein
VISSRARQAEKDEKERDEFMKKEIIPPKIQIPPISVEDKIKMFKTALVSKSNT